MLDLRKFWIILKFRGSLVICVIHTDFILRIQCPVGRVNVELNPVFQSGFLNPTRLQILGFSFPIVYVHGNLLSIMTCSITMGNLWKVNLDIWFAANLVQGWCFCARNSFQTGGYVMVHIACWFPLVCFFASLSIFFRLPVFDYQFSFGQILIWFTFI